MLRLLSLAICAQSALAAVTMPRWFGDYMVLQTNAEYGYVRRCRRRHARCTARSLHGSLLRRTLAR